MSQRPRGDAALGERLLNWRSQGQWFEHQGHRMFYRHAGQGSAVLLVHGYPTSSYDWHALWPLLLPQHRLLAPDMLGLGFSDKPATHAYSIPDHALLHDNLLQALGIRDVHLLAHDLGVSVAQEMLARRAEQSDLARIRSLTLLNGGFCPEAYRPRWVQRMMATPLGAGLGPHLPRAAIDRTLRELFAGSYVPSQELLDDFWALINHHDGRRVAHAVGRFWRDRLAVRDRLVQPLLQGATPLRLINGAADPNSGHHMAMRLKALLPQLDLCSLEQVGHWPQLEVPQRVAQCFQDFVRRHDGR